jgi:hypothetical protein
MAKESGERFACSDPERLLPNAARAAGSLL